MSPWKVISIDVFVDNVPILCPLKTPLFSDVFRGYKMETLPINGLSNLLDFRFIRERLKKSDFWKRRDPSQLFHV